jgi:hypothetical protein
VIFDRGAQMAGIIKDESRHDPSRGYAGGYEMETLARLKVRLEWREGSVSARIKCGKRPSSSSKPLVPQDPRRRLRGWKVWWLRSK